MAGLKKKDAWVKKDILFKAIYSEGSSVAGREIVLKYLFVGGEGRTKAGFSVAKRIGNAVVRNKIKRRLKNIIRAESHRIKKGYALVFICRTAVASRSFPETSAAVTGLLQRAGLLEDHK
ncbi:MAG TPA: ribonuclease P protein component [Actinobacteria bacterium]|nr:ribonuclease P protein component [Actinomycetota bacterium]